MSLEIFLSCASHNKDRITNRVLVANAMHFLWPIITLHALTDYEFTALSDIVAAQSEVAILPGIVDYTVFLMNKRIQLTFICSSDENNL